MIFEDFEMMNKEEINQLRRKVRKNNKYKHNNEHDANRNNINNNYNNIKNIILKTLKRKVRYFFIRSSSVEKIKVLCILIFSNRLKLILGIFLIQSVLNFKKHLKAAMMLFLSSLTVLLILFTVSPN